MSDTGPPPGSRSPTQSTSEVMGSRPPSPGSHPEPQVGPQPGGPDPDVQHETEEPEGAESGATPSPQGPAGPPAAEEPTSVVFLAEGCALLLQVGDIELVLEPDPTSILQVSVGEHTFLLVPEALLEPCILLDAPGEGITVQQGFFCACFQEIVAQEETYQENEDPELQPPSMDDGAAGSTGLHASGRRVFSSYLRNPAGEPSSQVATFSPEGYSPDDYFGRDPNLLEPCPSSSFQPPPPRRPFRGSARRARRQRARGAVPKSRRGLLRE